MNLSDLGIFGKLKLIGTLVRVPHVERDTIPGASYQFRFNSLIQISVLADFKLTQSKSRIGIK